jgi:hypothetical protein
MFTDEMRFRILQPTFRTALFAALLIGFFIFFNRSALAQSEGWSNPVNISNSAGNSSSPSLAVDAAGNVHLVWIEETEDERQVVMYTTLGEDGWREANDIFISNGSKPIQNVQLLGDSLGNLHIFFYWQGIQYSRAYAPEAGSARSWSIPQTLIPEENFLSSPNAVITPEGQIHLVFAIEIGDGNGIYYHVSKDDGDTWSDPVLVYANPAADRRVTSPKIAVDGQKQTHIVWVETSYPETYPPLGIRYTSSSDGVTWGEPHFLAEGPYTDPEILAVNESELHVVWSGTATDRFKFHTWSTDSGITWREIWRNDELGGIQGSPALVVDSLARIYWLKVGTVFVLSDDAFPNKDSLHENIFENDIWSTGTIILNSPTRNQNLMHVTAVISNGNQLHTTVMNPLPTTGEDYQFDIYYLNKSLDAPSKTIRSLPTATAPDISILTPDALANAAPPSSDKPKFNMDTNPVPMRSSWIVVTAGLLPASLLLLIIMFIVKRKK